MQHVSEPVRVNRQAMYDLLNTPPDALAFSHVVSLCVHLDTAANLFWQQRV